MKSQGIFGPFWQKMQKIIDLSFDSQGFLEAFSGRPKFELVPGDIKIFTCQKRCQFRWFGIRSSSQSASRIPKT